MRQRIYGHAALQARERVAQLVGHKGVAKRLDTIAVAMCRGATAPELADLELAAAMERTGIWRLSNPARLAALRADKRREDRELASIRELPSPDQTIDLNTASENELLGLPGVGKVLAGRILHARLREVPGAGTGGYQVVMPPAASLEEAQATAGRIGAAGFDDFLVVRQGEQANGIALGRYRSREAAERRLTQLQAAGFPAQMQTVGRAGPSLWWLDAGAAAGADVDALARLASSGAPQPLECAALR